jgi:hypothetical protein
MTALSSKCRIKSGTSANKSVSAKAPPHLPRISVPMLDPVVQLELQRWPRTQPSRRVFRPLLWFWAVTLTIAFGGAATLQVLGPPAKGVQQTAGDALGSRSAARPPPPAWTLQPDDHAPTPVPQTAVSEPSQQAARDMGSKPQPPAAESSTTENAASQDPEPRNAGSQTATAKDSDIQDPDVQNGVREKTAAQNSASEQSASDKSVAEKQATPAADPSRQASNMPSARKPVADPVQLALGRLRRQQKQQQLARGPDRSAPSLPNESGDPELGYHERPDPRFSPSPQPPAYYWPYAWAPTSPRYSRWRFFP